MQLKSWVAIAGIIVSSIVGVGSVDRVNAVTTVLYDGASGVTPNLFNAPNPYLNFISLGSGASQSAGGGVTTLNTNTSEFTYAGYTNYNNNLTGFTTIVNPQFPTLDRNTGYTLSFTVKVNSQTNNGTNGDFRAGFSALVLGNDNRGIEIGFRNPNTKDGSNIPDIFAQNDASFNSIVERNTTIGTLLSSLNTYDLTVFGDTYTLKNGSNTLLAGALRNYTAAVGVGNSYTNPNFIFLGDNTTSAGASVDISRIAITTNTTNVPEPSNLIGIGLAIGFGIKLKARLSKSNREFTKLLK
ncbi:PEP-CTERM sorting domain-containing protein [Chamaesiphon minutus]|uniref:PEP-CTERM putative exosortase interaction domain-containing protein n=1 Tax=Chamaesiphon minutus (strain ATCC 27169 / PCC 6605) TaxID=1173020 RepID=K9UH20_CHAP6|nr:PEP-CTERM sorting domain-containing protein [Chamaesiphon minutus]AFY93943.1 PEP-CTERM putative exosortase interaction domain-containing protein [Chamaesiphon minutus PCC 6605]